MTRPGLSVTLVLLAGVAAGLSRAAADSPRDDHRPIPAIVAGNAAAGVRGCATCHLTNGFGRPENASLAGLPAEYLEEQIADYRRGVRMSADPMQRPEAMSAIAARAEKAAVRAACEYFASIPFGPWVRVVEAEIVPKTRVVGGALTALEDGSFEPIGPRVVEVRTDAAVGQSGAAVGYVAYVPTGSIKKGEALVTSGGGGRTVRCALCHGETLTGLGAVPGIAGRSPTYQIRQLLDIQRGARRGLHADLMRPTVARLTRQDMVAIAAYTASLAP